MDGEAPSVVLQHERLTPEEMEQRARDFADHSQRRRTVREFSSEPVAKSVIEHCIRAASTAPSGAHKQPWHFVAVTDPGLKTQIKEAAEEEERAFYGGRAPKRWLTDLMPFGTGPEKPFLEIAPVLIVVFAERRGASAEERNYYVQESVGIATGMLLTALHAAGLVALTHTPSPMGFLREILGRPEHERPFLLIPVGHPADGCRVPDLERKALSEVLTWR